MNLQEILKRFLHNAAIIVGSRVVFGLLNLATNALVVKAFGLADLGVLVLLQAYTRLFSDLIKFDTWQAVLSFGTPLQEAKNDKALRSLLGFTLSLDLLCITIALITALIFIPFATDIFEWPRKVADFAPYFAISILFMLQGTPNGVLRFVDRVDILAWQFALNAIIRFVGVCLAILLKGDVFHLVLAWFAANTVSGFLPMIFSYRELAKRHLLPRFNVKWHHASKQFHRIWRFLFMTNISNAMTLLYDGGSVILAGALLGPAAAATLQITKQFAVAISKPTTILGPLISPEFAKLAATGNWKIFQRLIKRQLFITIAVLILLGGILLAVLGPIVDAVYGAALIEHLLLFQIFIIGSIITMTTFSFEPAVLAVNKPTLVLGLKSGAVILYIIGTLSLITLQDVYAFGFAFLISQVAYVIAYIILGTRLLKRLLAKSASVSAAR